MNFFQNIKVKVLDWINGYPSRTAGGYSSAYGIYQGGRALGGIPSGFRADQNSIVASAIDWSKRNLPEPPLRVYFPGEDGKPEAQPDHELAPLFGSPNLARHTMARLIGGLALSWILDGNAYLVLTGRKGLAGYPSEMYYVPHWQMRPVADSNDPAVLSYYEHRNGLKLTKYAIDEVVHLAFGVDPDNTLLGCSALKSTMRMVMSDEEISIYCQHVGIRTAIISPEHADTTIQEEDMELLEQKFLERSSGPLKGKPMVFNKKLGIGYFGMTPAEMAIDKLTQIPETRICAAIGIPAIVLGLAAGLNRSTFSNYGEAREAATEDYCVPFWRALGEAFTTQLLIDADRAAGYTVAFDLTEVRAIQEDETERQSRVFQAWTNDLLTQNEARAMLGMRSDLAGGERLHSEIAGGIGDAVKALTKQDLAAKWRHRVSEHQQASEADV